MVDIIGKDIKENKKFSVGYKKKKSKWGWLLVPLALIGIGGTIDKDKFSANTTNPVAQSQVVESDNSISSYLQKKFESNFENYLLEKKGKQEQKNYKSFIFVLSQSYNLIYPGTENINLYSEFKLFEDIVLDNQSGEVTSKKINKIKEKLELVMPLLENRIKNPDKNNPNWKNNQERNIFVKNNLFYIYNMLVDICSNLSEKEKLALYWR